MLRPGKLLLHGCLAFFINSCSCPACVRVCHIEHVLPKYHGQLRNSTDDSLISEPRVPCSELVDSINVTCYQLPWVRAGLFLLLLCGLILPTLMAAFIKFSWTGLVVQLFFAQSFWSVHEMSTAMEKHFLWDLIDTNVAEYQVRAAICHDCSVCRSYQYSANLVSCTSIMPILSLPGKYSHQAVLLSTLPTSGMPVCAVEGVHTLSAICMSIPF